MHSVISRKEISKKDEEKRDLTEDRPRGDDQVTRSKI